MKMTAGPIMLSIENNPVELLLLGSCIVTVPQYYTTRCV